MQHCFSQNNSWISFETNSYLSLIYPSLNLYSPASFKLLPPNFQFPNSQSSLFSIRRLEFPVLLQRGLARDSRSLISCIIATRIRDSRRLKFPALLKRGLATHPYSPYVISSFSQRGLATCPFHPVRTIALIIFFFSQNKTYIHDTKRKFVFPISSSDSQSRFAKIYNALDTTRLQFCYFTKRLNPRIIP